MTTLGRPDVGFHAPYDFVAANKEYVADFSPSPDDLTRGPRSRTAIITCVDGRTIPEMFFQLKPNEAWSIRNGGGRANDPSTIRSLMTIQAFSELKEVKVVHHKSKYSLSVSLPFLFLRLHFIQKSRSKIEFKDCGSLYYNQAWVCDCVDDLKRAEIGGKFGDNGRAFAEQVATLAFRRDGNESDEKDVVVNSVIQDVQYLRNHPLIKPTVLVTGWYLDLHNGRVEEVKC